MKIKILQKSPKTQFPFVVGVPALVWQGLFFYIPLLLLIISSFVKLSEKGQFLGFTLDNIWQFFSTTYLKVILASLLLALVNACLCFCLAFPLAYFLAFRAKKQKNLFLFFLIVPFWTNFLLHIYAWFYVLENHGFINTILLKLHIILEPFNMLNSIPAILVMMVYYYLPFMVLPIYASLERFNYTLIEASYDLGARFGSTFRQVLLPIASSGVRAGFFLVFIPSFGEFAIPELMGGDKHMFVGNVVSSYILGEGTGALGAAFTLVSILFLIVATIALYYGLTKLLNPRRRRG